MQVEEKYGISPLPHKKKKVLEKVPSNLFKVQFPQLLSEFPKSVEIAQPHPNI